MSTEYTTVSDNDVTLAIPGEIASVRARLVEAIQKLGYKVLGEQPIYAKRAKQGAACYDCSINVLDYATTLTVSLKQANDSAVLATFSYEIKSYMSMTKGDRQTLAREAEAVIALATERLAISACRSCGTQVTDESHFCRRCGAPLVLDVPELEVLRLTRNARGSYHHIFVGFMTLLLAVLTVLAMFIVNGAKLFGPMFWVGIPLLTYGLFMLLRGTWQLHRTLNSDSTKMISTSQPAFRSSVTTALPPAPVNASVTEATTSLLSSVRDQRVKEPIHRKDPNTAELDTDQLM
ncbi:MAG TPA: zinc-ribbon domain-containing protein [Pyrinomonadaceae bacterium]|nr:zinc-ribbon domain-containing protein [Pyrinomonadaceae bacterium]